MHTVFFPGSHCPGRRALIWWPEAPSVCSGGGKTAEAPRGSPPRPCCTPHVHSLRAGFLSLVPPTLPFCCLRAQHFPRIAGFVLASGGRPCPEQVGASPQGTLGNAHRDLKARVPLDPAIPIPIVYSTLETCSDIREQDSPLSPAGEKLTRNNLNAVTGPRTRPRAPRASAERLEGQGLRGVSVTQQHPQAAAPGEGEATLAVTAALGGDTYSPF